MANREGMEFVIEKCYTVANVALSPRSPDCHIGVG